MFHRAAGSPDHRLGRYDHLIVHVTATKASMDIGAADVDRWHRDKGWRGCGYHAVIRRNGLWEDRDGGFSARPIGHCGAHVGDCGPGWNCRSFGISMAGGIDDNGQPENNMTFVQIQTLRAGIETFLELHPNKGAVRVLGHRDLIWQTGAPPKACPCFDVIPWWNNLSTDDDEDDAGSDFTTPMTLGDTWTVRSGDTLGRIASDSGVRLSALLGLNPSITNPDQIQVGQVIKLR